MFKSFKYRIYPNKSQEILINKHIGASRFIFNIALETKNTVYKSSGRKLSHFDLIKQLPELKKECVWLNEVNAQTLQQSVQKMDIAFKNFFKGSGFPKFKKKSGNGSFSVPQKVVVKNSKLVIPKFSEGIKLIMHRPLKGRIKQATISKTTTGKYFVSILCDTGDLPKKKSKITEKSSIGIDLGIKHYIVTSKGEVIENPKYLNKSESKLIYLQRRYSRSKGKRVKKRLSLLHEKVKNRRKDFINKISAKLISENQTICLEDLSIKNMIKNHNLAKCIQDVSWYSLTSSLEYKANWYGVNIIKINRFTPSSKACSNCGYINKDLQLRDRTWCCNNCKSILDRDLNAAINIKKYSLKSVLPGIGRENQKELPTLVGVMTSEVK